MLELAPETVYNVLTLTIVSNVIQTTFFQMVNVYVIII